MRPRLLLLASMSLAFILSSCVIEGISITAPTPPKFTPPTDWRTIERSESEFRKYFDENIDNLNALEGIWTLTSSSTWRNILSGINGASPGGRNAYRIAIISDSTKPNYDLSAVVLESENPNWKPGRIKAHFRKTAYEKVYETLWYAGNYSEFRDIYVLDELGLIKHTRTFRSPEQEVIEVTEQAVFVKAYPAIRGKSRPSGGKKLSGTGSGFLLSSTGFIVTNYHVVENAKRIEVSFFDKNITKNASIRIRDTKNDIAIREVNDVLFADISTQPIPFSFADANSVKVGQEVFTLGFPLGDIMGTKSRLSTGGINSLFGSQDDPRLFQISNPLQPGNSGGPLFNNRGDLVGIVLSSLNRC